MSGSGGSGRRRPVVVCVLDLDEASSEASRLEGTVLSPSGPFGERAKHVSLRSSWADLERAVADESLIYHPEIEIVARAGRFRAGVPHNPFDQDEVPKPRCRLHLFAYVAPTASDTHFAVAQALVEIAEAERIPVVLHALVGEPRAVGEATVQGALERYDDLLRGRGQIGTLSGIRTLNLADGAEPWEPLLDFYRAAVRGDAPSAHSWPHALSDGYDAGFDDESALPPTRIGDYEGVAGDFTATFGAQARQWRWVGRDVGFVLDLGEARVARLGALLRRAPPPAGLHVPAEVLDRLHENGRAVVAFDDDSLRSIVGGPSCHVVPVAYSVTEPLVRAAELLIEAGGAHIELHAGTAAETARAVDALSAAVDGGEHDLLVGYLGEPRLERGHPDDVDARIGELAESVKRRGGTLALTTARRQAGSPSPLVWVEGDDPGELHPEVSLEDVAAAIVEQFALPSPKPWVGRGLRKPRG